MIVTNTTPALPGQFRAPATAYKTYGIVAPLSTHWRPATCVEVDCCDYLNGWQSAFAPDDQRADYVRRHSGRRFVESRTDDGRVLFTFAQGQTCFRAADHRIRVGRPELFVVRDGDRRGNPFGTTPYVHSRPQDWVEDFAEHQAKVALVVERG